jgi:arginine deiminase
MGDGITIALIDHTQFNWRTFYMVSTIQQSLKRSVKYGIENRGKLRTIIMHTPQKIEDTFNDDDDNTSRKLRDNEILEYGYLCQFFESMGIEIIQLQSLITENSDLIPSLPYLMYPGYSTVVSNKGAFISRMAHPERRNEEFVIKEALKQLSIPILHEFQSTDHFFEGFIPFDRNILFLTITKNHHSNTIITFIQQALIYFNDVVLLTPNPGCQCTSTDAIFNKIRNDCALYCPAEIKKAKLYRRYSSEEINLEEYCWKKNIGLIAISMDEQHKNACSFVSIDNETIANFDYIFYSETIQALKNRNIRLITFRSYHLQQSNSSMSSYILPIYRS